MSKFNPVTEEVVSKLKEIVGEKYVIYNDKEKLEEFSHDEVAEKEYHHYPDIVVKPITAQEISKIMKLANEYLIPVTPRGAGSGLSGGAIPEYGGIVLSIERMNKILEIDTKNLIAVVEPGVITNEINKELEKYDLFFAGYPMSLESCFIGGNVAENAGGGKAVKYGVTERYIYGIEAVLPTGEIVKFGGKIMKDVTGYDIKKLLIGSEGTLAIFTKIYIKLLPLPKYVMDLLLPFETIDAAIDAVPLIITETKIIPTAIEFMDALSVEKTAKYLNEEPPYKDAGAYLIIELDGNDEESLLNDVEKIGELCMEHGAIDAFVADNATTREKIWKVRRNIAEALKAFYPHQSLEDVVVPTSEIPKFVRELEEISKKYNIEIPCYGHAGDGNLHATPIKLETVSEKEWYEKLPKVLEEMYKAAAKYGGTISGEHGIGNKRKKYLNLVMGNAEIELMKRIKKAFDPNNVLNPGKIFDM